MRELDINNSVAITRDIFWTGFYEESSKLHCNPYLLIDNEDVVVFDPGSIPDFPVVMRKMIDHVNPSEISLIVVSHQDPDVCGNLAVLENLIERDDLKVAAHTNTIRLIQHLGIESEFYPVEKNNNEIILKSGRKLEFIFVPFLHSPGAIVTYDTETKSLFTGDIFGTIGDDWSLFAGGEGFPECMKSFHQTYMPSNKVLRVAMEKFEKMDIEWILPQHGSVIERKNIPEAIAYLKELPCGVDLIGD